MSEKRIGKTQEGSDKSEGMNYSTMHVEFYFTCKKKRKKKKAAYFYITESYSCYQTWFYPVIYCFFY